MMTSRIRGCARVLGAGINTDVNCSSKYMPGKDAAFVATCAFEQVAPGYAQAFRSGDIIVAGRHFGINSSREQAIHVMRLMGVAAIVATSFGRQFFRNAINNGLPVIECDIGGIADGDAIEVDLAAGRVSVAARSIVRSVPPLPAELQALLAAGGLVPFLKQHPDWKLA